jgi:hypothetical protein
LFHLTAERLSSEAEGRLPRNSALNNECARVHNRRQMVELVAPAIRIARGSLHGRKRIARLMRAPARGLEPYRVDADPSVNVPIDQIGGRN